MSNWYLEAHCSSCGGKSATNGKPIWCISDGCQNNARKEMLDNGANTHKPIHKKGKEISNVE
jgi:hypothetical protein